MGSSSDGDLIFTKAAEQLLFLIKHCMEPSFWTRSAGMVKVSRSLPSTVIQKHEDNPCHGGIN